MGLDNVLIITDALDENLYLSSRNLPNVLVIEARHADPVSLMRFDEGPGHARPRSSTRGGARMNQERLMKVILAPVISEKTTMVGETRKPGGVRGPAGRDQGRDQGRGRAAVQGAEGRGGAVNVVNVRARKSATAASSAAARPARRPT